MNMNPLAKIETLRGLYAAVLCRFDGTVVAQTSPNPKFARVLIDSARHWQALAAARAGGGSWHSVVLRFSRGTIIVRRNRSGTLLVWGTSTMDVASDVVAQALRTTVRGLDATEPAPPAISGERPAAMASEPMLLRRTR